MPRWERVAFVAVAFVGGLGAAMVATIALAAFSYVLSSLAYEEEQDWATQPLEVVVDEAERACILNVEGVAPGRHEVLVIANDAESRVVIRSPSDRVVFRQVVQPEDTTRSKVPTVRLRLGSHEVECRTSAWTGTTELPVVAPDELG